jgi:hypothetical protein
MSNKSLAARSADLFAPRSHALALETWPGGKRCRGPLASLPPGWT